MRTALRASAAALAAISLWACGSGPVSCRKADITAAGLAYQSCPTGYDGTDKFTWDPGAQQAYVRFDGTSLTAGKVDLSFVDSSGHVILSQTLTPGPVPDSKPTGQQQQGGPWTVRLDYNGASGDVAFSAAPSR